MSDVTRILDNLAQGDNQAASALLPLVYEELRRLASQKLGNEQAGQTLQPTALVHEAYLRLIGPANVAGFANRRHFFAAAAEAMRRILVDEARRKQAVRHGGDAQRQHPDLDQLPQVEQSDELLSVHEALDHLAMHDALKAELVKLRYFAGFTNDEAAELLGISSKNAEKQWVYARAWLKNKLSTLK